jgi:hypothetical protein
MYCPSCGSEERQLSQYCRACGTDLRLVRTTLERPDAITASAVSAREEISKAVAESIRELESGEDLKHFADHVLPQLQKFFESPEERRLRRIRAGVITSTVGLALTIVTLVMALADPDFWPFVSSGLITLFVGVGLVLNGLVFSIPRKELPGETADALSQVILDSKVQKDLPQPRAMTNELSPSKPAAPSITEHTTHHLKSKS